MRRLLLIMVAAPVLAPGQDEGGRFEARLSWWRTSITGQVQAAGLPVDLSKDLALADQNTFFGHASVRLARRHRIFVEGSPYRFSGANLLERSIVYNNRQFDVNTTVVSEADLNYLGAGYQFDAITGARGHLGLNVSGAWLDATGTIASRDFAVSGTRSQTIGIPLAGAEFRAFVIPRRVSVDADFKGMSLGDYGHYWRFEAGGAIHFGLVAVRAGYAMLDANVHESRNDPMRAGISPRIRGPFAGLEFRLP